MINHFSLNIIVETLTSNSLGLKTDITYNDHTYKYIELKHLTTDWIELNREILSCDPYKLCEGLHIAPIVSSNRFSGCILHYVVVCNVAATPNHGHPYENPNDRERMKVGFNFGWMVQWAQWHTAYAMKMVIVVIVIYWILILVWNKWNSCRYIGIQFGPISSSTWNCSPIPGPTISICWSLSLCDRPFWYNISA